jgi:hypothetical protein
MESFGIIDVLAELDGANIHRLSNALTLDMSVHAAFDGLKLWFEEVPVSNIKRFSFSPWCHLPQGAPNTYTVCSTGNLAFLNALPPARQVHFTTNTGQELPDPRYLKLHAAVCRVAHMSGAAGYLDFCDREYEKQGRHGVMAHDGSSARLLESRLQMMSLRA